MLIRPYEVRQDGLTSLGDGQTPPAPMARMGLPAIMNKWDMFALAGRMFSVSQTTVGTALTNSAANGAAIVLTVPTIRLTVPVGLTFFPHRLQLSYEAMAGTANELAVVSCTSASTTGGLALTPVSLRQDEPVASGVTNVMSCSGAAITEGAITLVRAHWQSVEPLAFAAEAGNKTWNICWEDLRPVVGPAAFIIYAGAVTTASTMMFTLEWAEVPTSAVKA